MAVPTSFWTLLEGLLSKCLLLGASQTRFWSPRSSILEPLGPQKHSIFIKRVIRFKLFAIFVSDAALGHENHPKKLQMLFPSTPNGTPEEPRSVQERPGRAPRDSKNHSLRALRAPLGVQKASWGGIGSLGASFWSPQGQFYLIFPTLPELLFSRLFSLLFCLLSLFSLICYPFYRLFSLSHRSFPFDPLFSLLSSLS